MAYNTDDLRIREIKELSPPSHFMREFPCTEKEAETTFRARESVHRISNTLSAVGDEVSQLETVSASLATRIRSGLAGPTGGFALDKTPRRQAVCR